MNRVSSGMPMLSKKALSLLTMTFVVLCLMQIGMDREVSGQDRVSITKRLLIMDFSSLSCPLCLQSFMEFVNVIHANKLEDSVLGVMIMDAKKEESDEERHRKIAEKRLKGFISGNNIQFPFLLDEERVFRPLNQDASATLIVLNTQKKTVEKYEFPLNKSQLATIIN